MHSGQAWLHCMAGRMDIECAWREGSAEITSDDGGVTPRTWTAFPSATIVVLAVIGSPPICDFQKG